MGVYVACCAMGGGFFFDFCEETGFVFGLRDEKFDGGGVLAFGDGCVVLFESAFDRFEGFAQFGAGFVVGVVVEAFADCRDALFGFREGEEGHCRDFEGRLREGWVDLEDMLEICNALGNLALFKSTARTTLAEFKSSVGDEDGSTSLRHTALPIPALFSISREGSCSLRFLQIGPVLRFLLLCRSIVLLRTLPVGIAALDSCSLGESSFKARLQDQHLVEVTAGLSILAEGQICCSSFEDCQVVGRVLGDCYVEVCESVVGFALREMCVGGSNELRDGRVAGNLRRGEGVGDGEAQGADCKWPEYHRRRQQSVYVVARSGEMEGERK